MSAARTIERPPQDQAQQCPIADKHLLEIPDFCELYSTSRSAAYIELRAGRLKAKKVGDRTLIPRESAQAWAAALPDYQSSEAAA